MKKQIGKNREQIGAENREKMWEEVPDTFGEKLFFEFFKSWKMTLSKSIKSWKNHFFQIRENMTGFSDPENRPNLG